MNPVTQIDKMPGLKDSYGFVSTQAILDTFEEKGWVVSKVDVMNPRKTERKGFQRHLIRMHNPALPEIPGLSATNKSIPELVLLNSHDGTTALRLFIGLTRFVCMNGIIAGTSLSDFKAVHSKSVLTRVTEGIDTMVENMPRLFDQVLTLQSLQFKPDKLEEFVKFCVDLRLSTVHHLAGVEYDNAVEVMRIEDKASDAFTVMNRVQEKILRGGIRYTQTPPVRLPDGTIVGSALRHNTTKAVRSIARQVELNRMIFDKAMLLAG